MCHGNDLFTVAHLHIFSVGSRYYRDPSQNTLKNSPYSYCITIHTLKAIKSVPKRDAISFHSLLKAAKAAAYSIRQTSVKSIVSSPP